MSQSPEFFGKFILLERLATGGMAEVYLAKSTGAENVAKFVAVKRILPHLSQNDDFIKMFKEEAKIAVNLSHRNIVSIFEFGEEKKQFFLVMEYVQGQNLRQLINRAREKAQKPQVQHGLYIISEVAQGLEHAHRTFDRNTGRPLNIIHRDISPQNIMVSYDGDVKIVDFGIAKAESKIETTQAGTLKGKFSYMSPEQAEGQDLDQRSDIFSLGIVLWELLANERLFANNDERMILRRVREADVPPVRRINPGIPQELERITSKALARDKNLRYQTAGDLHRDLNSFLNRQFPDYTSQDLAHFTSGLFDRETLDIRKRLVEYARIQMSDSPDNTATATATETLTGDNANAGPQGLKSLVENTNLNVDDLQFQIVTPKAPPKKPAYMPDSGAGTNTARKVAVQTKSVSGPKLVKPIEIHDESKSFIPALFWMALVLGFAGLAFVYGPNFNTPQPVIQAFDRLKCRVISCPPIDIPNNGQASKGASIPPAPAAAIVGMQVTTEPPLASVFVDGELIGLSPATHQSLPVGKTVQIRIEKDSYLPVVIMHRVLQTGDLPPIPLQKAATGYLRIENTVYTITELTVDGNPVLQKPPIEKLLVPANRDVVVVAKSKTLAGVTKEFRKSFKVESGRATQVFIEFK